MSLNRNEEAQLLDLLTRHFAGIGRGETASAQLKGPDGSTVDIPRAVVITEHVVTSEESMYPFGARSSISRMFVLIDCVPDDEGTMMIVHKPEQS